MNSNSINSLIEEVRIFDRGLAQPAEGVALARKVRPILSAGFERYLESRGVTNYRGTSAFITEREEWGTLEAFFMGMQETAGPSVL